MLKILKKITKIRINYKLNKMFKILRSKLQTYPNILFEILRVGTSEKFVDRASGHLDRNIGSLSNKHAPTHART